MSSMAVETVSDVASWISFISNQPVVGSMTVKRIRHLVHALWGFQTKGTHKV